MLDARRKTSEVEQIGFFVVLLMLEIGNSLGVRVEKMRLNEIDRTRHGDRRILGEQRQMSAAAEPVQMTPFELAANLFFGAVADADLDLTMGFFRDFHLHRRHRSCAGWIRRADFDAAEEAQSEAVLARLEDFFLRIKLAGLVNQFP